MTADAALERLQHERGHALDPRVVDAFVRAYPVLEAQAEVIGKQSIQLHSVPPPHNRPGGTPVESPTYAKALHEISLAHREIQALYDIAQGMSRSLGVHATMNRLSDTLSALVPLSSCALFVPGDEAGTIGCRFASGVDADRIQRLTMRDGQWSTEWVDWRRRLLRHAHAEADPDVTEDAYERTVLASALLCPIFNDGLSACSRSITPSRRLHRRSRAIARPHLRAGGCRDSPLGRSCSSKRKRIHFVIR